MIVANSEFINPKVFFMPISFAEWLGSNRVSRGLSKRQIEKDSGVSNAMLTMLEQGKRNPSREMVVKIASAIGADLNEALLSAGFTQNTQELTREPEMPSIRIRIPPGYEHLDDEVARAAEDAASDAYRSVADILRRHGSRFSIGAVPDESESEGK